MSSLLPTTVGLDALEREYSAPSIRIQRFQNSIVAAASQARAAAEHEQWLEDVAREWLEEDRALQRSRDLREEEERHAEALERADRNAAILNALTLKRIVEQAHEDAREARFRRQMKAEARAIDASIAARGCYAPVFDHDATGRERRLLTDCEMCGCASCAEEVAATRREEP